jgi:hypothetical protein
MKTLVIVLNILWTLALIPSCMGAMMSPMLFDAPGSDSNKVLWMIFWSTAALPLIIIASQIGSWIIFAKTDYSLAWKVSCLPLVDILLLVILWTIFSK